LFFITEQSPTQEIAFLLMFERRHETNRHDYSVVAAEELSPFQSDLLPSDMVIKPDAMTGAVTFAAL
jgi:hypothetical protein